MKLLKELKKREKAAYPSYMRQMQHCRNWSDLQEYCESDHIQVHLLGDTGYLILSEDEVIDWVGAPGTVFKMMSIVKHHFGDRPFGVDLRSTSYPIIELMARRNKLSIHDAEIWWWDNEQMVASTIQIK